MRNINEQTPYISMPINEARGCGCMFCPIMYLNYHMLRSEMMTRYTDEFYNSYYRDDWVMINDYIMYSKSNNVYYNTKSKYLAFFSKKHNSWMMWDGRKVIPFNKNVFLCKGPVLMGVCSETPRADCQTSTEMYEVVEAAMQYNFRVFISLFSPLDKLSGYYYIEIKYGVNTNFDIEVKREETSEVKKFNSSHICFIRIEV